MLASSRGPVLHLEWLEANETFGTDKGPSEVSCSPPTSPPPRPDPRWSFEMIASVVLLIVSAVAIYFSCEFFVNGVEWVGRRAGVGETAVGTILAAFGTALPESVVTLVAVAFSSNPSGKAIGVGAALGGPLVLSCLAYPLVGGVLWLSHRRKGRRKLVMDSRRLARDQGWFLVIFLFKVALGLVAFAIKPWLGFAFLAAYALYVWNEMRTEESAGEEPLEPLKLRPKAANPSLAWALLQTSVAIVVIFGASQLFVAQLEVIGPWLGLSPMVVAVLLSPIATELPEAMNAIIWVRQGKERLALANISGSMMIQATVPSAFGIFFTPWLFDSALILAAGVTIVSILGLFLLLRRGALTPPRLASFSLLYVAFIALLPFVQRIPRALGARPGLVGPTAAILRPLGPGDLQSAAERSR